MSDQHKLSKDLKSPKARCQPKDYLDKLQKRVSTGKKSAEDRKHSAVSALSAGSSRGNNSPPPQMTPALRREPATKRLGSPNGFLTSSIAYGSTVNQKEV